MKIQDVTLKDYARYFMVVSETTFKQHGPILGAGIMIFVICSLPIWVLIGVAMGVLACIGLMDPEKIHRRSDEAIELLEECDSMLEESN